MTKIQRLDRSALLDRLARAWIARHSVQSAHTGQTYARRLQAVFPDLAARWQREGRLTATDAQELYEAWRNRRGHGGGGWSEATLNTTLAAVRTFWHDMAAQGLLPAECPFDAIPFVRPDLSRRVERVLTAEEAERVIRALPAGPPRILGAFLYATGCRISEALSATWGRFRRDARGDIYWTFLGKGRKTRTVWIQPPLWRLLQALPGPHEPGDRLFPYTRFWAYHQIRRAANRAGLRDRIVSPHVFRHTHATLAVEAGIPLPEIADQLGHADLRTTQIYVNLRPGPRSGRAIRLPEAGWE